MAYEHCCRKRVARVHTVYTVLGDLPCSLAPKRSITRSTRVHSQTRAKHRVKTFFPVLCNPFRLCNGPFWSSYSWSTIGRWWRLAGWFIINYCFVFWTHLWCLMLSYLYGYVKTMVDADLWCHKTITTSLYDKCVIFSSKNYKYIGFFLDLYKPCSPCTHRVHAEYTVYSLHGGWPNDYRVAFMATMVTQVTKHTHRDSANARTAQATLGEAKVQRFSRPTW